MQEVPESSAAHMARLQHNLERHHREQAGGKNGPKNGKGKADEGEAGGGALNAAILGANWSLAWALDSTEHPPPSSIVARRDTREARALALVADQAAIAEPSKSNPTSLWAAMLGLFTVDADRGKKSEESEREGDVILSVSGKQKHMLQKRTQIISGVHD